MTKAGCQHDKRLRKPHHCHPFCSPLKGCLEHMFSKLAPSHPSIAVGLILSTSAERMLVFLFLCDLLCRRHLGNTCPRTGRGCDRSQGPLPCLLLDQLDIISPAGFSLMWSISSYIFRNQDLQTLHLALKPSSLLLVLWKHETLPKQRASFHRRLAFFLHLQQRLSIQPLN